MALTFSASAVRYIPFQCRSRDRQIEKGTPSIELQQYRRSLPPGCEDVEEHAEEMLGIIVAVK